MLKSGKDVLQSLFRYVQLEMKIPQNLVKAKVDTGINKKRSIQSSKSVR
jgi:hypothetical protein